jgi:hemoglobin-like flavoprotein
MTTPLTDKQIRLVKESFLFIKPMQETAADLFYARLFELDPALRALFKNDMKEQGRKLVFMISTAVSSLHNPDKLIPAVRDLGSRHRGYGVTEQHFETVGNALIWTLSRGMGSQFTPETREAWTKVYTVLSEVMKSAMVERATPENRTGAVAPAPAVKTAPLKAPSLWGWLAQLYTG